MRSVVAAPDSPSEVPTRASSLLLGVSAVVFALFLGWHVHELHDHWKEVGGDLHIYLQGGQRILDHKTLYLPRPPHAYFPGLFTYTPFAALLFTWLPKLSWDVVKTLVEVGDVLLVVGCTWASVRLLGYGRGRTALTLTLALSGPMIFIQPVHWTMMAGQVNLLVLALILGDALVPDSRRFKGVLTGLAIAIKLTPGFFVLYFLLVRRFKAAITACVTFVATILFGFALLPHDSLKFWSGTFLDTRRVGPADYGDNQSLAGLLGRHFHTPDPPQPGMAALQVAFAALGLAIAVLAHRRGRELVALTTLGLTTLLISPISWSHHWVWLLPLFPLAVDRALAARSLVRTAVALVVTGVVWYVLSPGLDGTRDIHTSPPYIPSLHVPRTSFAHELQVNVLIYLGLVVFVALGLVALGLVALHGGPPGQREGPPGQREGTPGQREGTPGQREGTPGQREGTPGQRE